MMSVSDGRMSSSHFFMYYFNKRFQSQNKENICVFAPFTFKNGINRNKL